MITIHDEGRLLASSSILGVLPSQKLCQLAFASERFVFEDGEYVIRQGESVERGFLILAGRADISIRLGGETKNLATVGKGFLIGDHALIIGGPYRATARAKGRLDTLCIQRDALLCLLESDKEAMRALIGTLAERKAKAEQALSITLD